MVEWGRRILTTSIVIPTLYASMEYPLGSYTISMWFSLVAQIEYYGLIYKILDLVSTGEQVKKLLQKYQASYLIYVPTIIVVSASWWIGRDRLTYISYSYIAMFLCIVIRILQYVWNHQNLLEKLKDVKDKQTELQKSYAFTFLVVACDVLFLQFYSIPFIYSSQMYKYKGGYSFILFWLMNCFASDAGGLIIGNRFGKNPKSAKFCESISPAKTWIGVIGSILGSQFYAIGNYYIGRIGGFSWVPQITFTETVIMSLVSSIICILGDLFESLIKRSAAEKDSGRFFPGHGGMLDRLDSLLFSSPLLYFYILTYIAPSLTQA